MFSDDLVQRFTAPSRDFSPTPLWWWSGERVTRDRLVWQMERMADGGVYNLVVINLAPKGPMVGAVADDPAWFSDDWWDRFSDICSAAATLGMKIWFYDQIGFSGANLQGMITARHPEATGRAIHSAIVTLDGESRLPAMDGRELVAVYALAPHGPSWRRYDVDGGVVTDALPGEQVRLVHTVETAFDYLEPSAFALLQDFVHGEFDRRLGHYLGNVIAGSFQDELPAANTWTPRFLDHFRDLAGYDLLDHLPSLWEIGGDTAARVRGDYYRVRTALFEETVFKPLAAWHRERGMLLGADQMNPARAGYPTQATQLYSDYIRTHRHYSAAGSDHEGDARVHSSMADLYDHPRVWIESFHSSGWGGNLEETYDWLLPFFLSGATLYNPHASYFSTVASWFEWAPPSTDWRQPYFAQYPAFAGAISRTCSLLTWGRHEVGVGVLHPTASIQARLPLDLPVDHFGDGAIGGAFADVDRTQADYLAVVGTNNWFVTKPGVLDRLGVDFDIVDDDSVAGSTITDGVMRINGFDFRTLVLPSCDRLESATAAQLLAFVDHGGQLIFVGRPPAASAGLSGDDEIVRALAAHPGVTRLGDPDELAAALGDARGFVSADGPIRARRSNGEGVAFVPAAFPNASTFPLRTDTWIWKDYDFDPARYAASSTMLIAGDVAEVEIWNPATGTRRQAVTAVVEGGTEIEVDFGGAPAVFVAWREGAQGTAHPSPVPIARDVATTSDLRNGWDAVLVPTLDNTWGDFAYPASTEPAALEIWSMDWAEVSRPGEPAASWSRVKAGFGDEVLTCGPFPVGQAPAPLPESEIDGIRRSVGALDAGQDGWQRQVHSPTNGIDKDDCTPLGPKGRVPEEFVKTLSPYPGEAVQVRTLVSAPAAGSYEIVVGAAASKMLWVNGVRVGQDDGTYLLRARIELPMALNVVEYRLGADERPPGMSLNNDRRRMGSFFTVTAAGEFPSRPEFVVPGPDVVIADAVTYSTTADILSEVRRATLVTGAASALEVRIDGQPVARQEKVEYYESEWGATPMYFSHDLTSMLSPGRHVLELVSYTADKRNGVFADLVTEYADGCRSAVVSDTSWTLDDGSHPLPLRGRSSELVSCYAAVRPHPLVGAHWLAPHIELGAPTVRTSTTAHDTGAYQLFRFTVPAGTTGFTVPTTCQVFVTVDGNEHEIINGSVDLGSPLMSLGTVVVGTVESIRFGTGGSVWSGPVRVRTSAAPTPMGDLRDLALGSWSGGLRYSRRMAGAAGPAILDLGRVRGSVKVEVDGVVVGEAFCRPYRFDLAEHLHPEGEHEVAVTVFNTLGPYLNEASPTSWVFPSQLQSGILGPVTFTRRPPTTT